MTEQASFCFSFHNFCLVLLLLVTTNVLCPSGQVLHDKQTASRYSYSQFAYANALVIKKTTSLAQIHTWLYMQMYRTVKGTDRSSPIATGTHICSFNLTEFGRPTLTKYKVHGTAVLLNFMPWNE